VCRPFGEIVVDARRRAAFVVSFHLQESVNRVRFLVGINHVVVPPAHED
jgi:hypothetical protein